MNVIESRRGGSPHQFGLRVSTIRWADLSRVVTMKGPADGPGPLSCALLNASGVDVMLRGSSIPLPANMPFHSAYGLANVMTACLSSTPRVTEATRSAPPGLAIANASSLPLSAWICAAMSSHVIGVPSDHIAFGLMV